MDSEHDDVADREALVDQIRRLRAQVAQLVAENETLKRTALDRDYERPPHYR